MKDLKMKDLKMRESQDEGLQDGYAKGQPDKE